MSNWMKSLIPRKRNEETIHKQPVKSLRRAEASPSPSGIVSSKTREEYLKSFGDCPCDCSDKHDLSRCAAYVFRFSVPWSEGLQPKLELLHFSPEHKFIRGNDQVWPDPHCKGLMRLEWVRIDDICDGETKPSHPQLPDRYGYLSQSPFVDVECQRLLADDSNIQGREHLANDSNVEDIQRQRLSADDSKVQGQKLLANDSKDKLPRVWGDGQKNPSFHLRDWYVYGYVEVCTYLPTSTSTSTSTKAFEATPPSDEVWWEPPIPEDENALFLTGSVAGNPGDVISFRLEALPRGEDLVPIADAHPLLLAEGETSFDTEMSHVNTYYMEMNGTSNGSATLCFSVINPAMVAKFYASLFTNRWARDSHLHVTGSISMEFNYTPCSAPLYLFHAHNTLVKNGGPISLSNDFVPVIQFEKLTVRVDLSGHPEDQPEADDDPIACYDCIVYAIFDGDMDSMMEHNDIEDARHKSDMESVDGVELMASFLSFNKEIYS